MSDDPIVVECRDILRKLQFGWMKFGKYKKSKYLPGFVHPPDPDVKDSKKLAQHVTVRGYVTNQKYEFSDFHERLPDGLKKIEEISALKKFNQKFEFSVS